MQVISRQDALKNNLLLYFTGKPCKRGHLAYRYITKGECLTCRNIRYTSKREKYKTLNRNWKRNNNKDKVYANNYLRKFRRKAVNWANQNKINLIYQNCPQGYEVDHVLPLNGKLICGLHVESNLQYLTKAENMAKRNKFKPYVVKVI